MTDLDARLRADALGWQTVVDARRVDAALIDVDLSDFDLGRQAPPGRDPKPSRPRRHRLVGRRTLAAAAMLIVLAIAVGTWALAKPSRPHPRPTAAATRPCRSTFTVVEALDDDTAPGNIGITLVNAGPDSCLVSTTPPTVVVIGPSGAPAGPALHREKWHSVVAVLTVTPKDTIDFSLNEFLVCSPEPGGYTLRVTLHRSDGSPVATIDIPIGNQGRATFHGICDNGSKEIGTVSHLS